MNPLQAHPTPSADGLPDGNLPLVEPMRELRGFPLGTILLRLGLVGEGPINEGLAECERSRKPLGRFLVERGALEEGELSRALAIQKGFPFVRVEEVVPDLRAVALLSAYAANNLGALPLGYAGVVPVVAVADPTNATAIEEICATIGGEVVIAAACPARLKEALVAAYRTVDEPGPVVPIAAAHSAPAPEIATAFRVVALLGGERVDLARCGSRESAYERALELARELAAGGWVACEDRLVRADAVASIEILETSATP